MEKNKYTLAQTLDRLAEKVNDREREGADMNAVSWGYEEGVLISANEAKAIVEALTTPIQVKNKQEIANELRDKFDEGSYGYLIDVSVDEIIDFIGDIFTNALDVD